MVEYYSVKICGLERKLPIKAVGRNTRLANFNFLGDVALVERIADCLHEKLKKYNFDYIVGPESKVVPLLHALASRCGHSRYVVFRKSIKPYMVSPVVIEPMKHFPKHVKKLVIDGPDVDLIAGKKIAVVDDVISTGVTMRMVKHLLEKVGATPVVFVTVLRQGDSQFDTFENLVYLETLPIIRNEKNVG